LDVETVSKVKSILDELKNDILFSKIEKHVRKESKEMLDEKKKKIIQEEKIENLPIEKSLNITFEKK